ncbi:MAG TPA: NAD(P)/FAD-dependent oxidoreductase [Acidimicrobiales bacterium]|jgi:phytoene dehydrogenase-like protein
MSDAVVIGAGHNGLAAANYLADAGWDVQVFEAASVPGGAVRTAEVTAPGFRNDLFSAFYPLAAASPALRALHLEDHGLRWRRAPAVLAHPTLDGPTAVLSTDVDETAASLDEFAPGDGDAWRELYDQWERIGQRFVDTLMSPFPPVVPGLKLLSALKVEGALDLARLALLPVRRFGEERFRGAGGGLLLAGNALHADLTPEAAGSGLFGWMLAFLGQSVGFPVPQGGASGIVDALVDRLRSRGGALECDARVERVLVRGGRAAGVRLADGREVVARRAVLADTTAPALFEHLVGEEHLPAGFLAKLARFQWSAATVKVDWALSRPVPWADPACSRAGTVHLAPCMDDLSVYAMELATERVPKQPFLLFGQMTTTDPTRSPAGTESAWAYTHVPRRVRGDSGGDGITGKWDDRESAAFTERVEAYVERFAPGFRDTIVARHVMTPPVLEAANANLVGGEVNGGTAQLHQQLVFRPVPGLARPETPVPGLYLASSSAHPGGGVHGACGANAAKAALAHDRAARLRRALRRAVS